MCAWHVLGGCRHGGGRVPPHRAVRMCVRAVAPSLNHTPYQVGGGRCCVAHTVYMLVLVLVRACQRFVAARIHTTGETPNAGAFRKNNGAKKRKTLNNKKSQAT